MQVIQKDHALKYTALTYNSEKRFGHSLTVGVKDIVKGITESFFLTLS